jgi:glycosyltransferase involved in cell wall biosynthesis
MIYGVGGLKSAPRVVIHSHAFFPSIGGIETVSDRLALGLVDLGHEVTVITETPGEAIEAPYTLVRNPTLLARLSILRQSDVVISNGASLRCALPSLLLRKPFAWIHQGYQTRCLDGLGWWDSRTAPLTPITSIWFHCKAQGWPKALKQIPAFAIRIFISKYIAHNIVVSACVSNHIPHPRKILIANPHPLELFKQARESASRTSDFIFVGRLVSEKGCDVIINALAALKDSGETYTLLIVGNGPEETALKELAHTSSVASQVTFLDSKKDAALASLMAQCCVGLVPSVWEEPYGGVALELMAAGLPVITTEKSGPEDKVGNVGAVVAKGDVGALAKAMQATLTNARTHPEQISQELEALLEPYAEKTLVEQYKAFINQISTRSPTQ